VKELNLVHQSHSSGHCASTQEVWMQSSQATSGADPECDQSNLYLQTPSSTTRWLAAQAGYIQFNPTSQFLGKGPLPFCHSYGDASLRSVPAARQRAPTLRRHPSLNESMFFVVKPFPQAARKETEHTTSTPRLRKECWCCGWALVAGFELRSTERNAVKSVSCIFEQGCGRKTFPKQHHCTLCLQIFQCIEFTSRLPFSSTYSSM
jgi:hypothetical protein